MLHSSLPPTFIHFEISLELERERERDFDGGRLSGTSLFLSGTNSSDKRGRGSRSSNGFPFDEYTIALFRETMQRRERYHLAITVAIYTEEDVLADVRIMTRMLEQDFAPTRAPQCDTFVIDRYPTRGGDRRRRTLSSRTRISKIVRENE